MTTQAVQERQAGSPAGSSDGKKDPLDGMVSMRMVVLFNLLRRSTILSQRRMFSLSEIEWRIMTKMGGDKPLSLNDLADALVQDRGQLSRAVKSMVERKLLHRNRKPGGPEIEITLAPEGRKVWAGMVERAKERDRILTEGLDGEDLAAMRRVIEAMILRADKLMEEALAQEAS